MITAPPNLPDYSQFVIDNLGKLILFEERRYPFRKPIVLDYQRFNIMGCGANYTFLDGFDLRVSTGQDTNNTNLRIRGVTINGPVSLADCCYVLLTDVWFTDAGKLTLSAVWDSVLNNVHFHRCGGMTITDRPGKMASNPGGGQSNCITIRGGRFEGCTGRALTIRNSKKIIIDGVKFHGVYPNPLPFDHLVMDRVTSSMVTNCNFTVGGKSFVNLRNCSGLAFHNIMDDPREYAFEVDSLAGLTIGGVILAKRKCNKTMTV